MNIGRTKTKATGGITPEEKIKLDAVAREWIDIAMRTEPIEPDKIIPAINGLYAAAGLKKPRVIIAPSPAVMAAAYGASAWIWYCRKHDTATLDATLYATDDATDDATLDATLYATLDATSVATYAATADATHVATRAATADATRAATHAATADATYAATDAMQACSDLAGTGGIECAKRWSNVYQGGNMWAAWCSYLVGFRDVIGLDLPEHKAFKFYEEAARHGSFRVMHDEFCIVSDFPEIIKKDNENRPHCENGASHLWRDGWALYHWHGVRIPDEWLSGKPPTASEALNWPNIEQRRAACEIVGWKNILGQLNAKVIDADGDEEIGTLLECDIPDSGKERFLKVLCGTQREFVLPVPREMKTAIEANAWTYGLDAKDMQIEIRT